MEQQFVVITEAPPQLGSLESEDARHFLKLYHSYENRVGKAAAIPMRNLIEVNDLEDLILETEELLDAYRAARAAEAAAGLAAAAGPGAAIGAEPGPEAEGSEASSDADTVPDENYPHLGNQHIEDMLTAFLGPKDVRETKRVLEEVRIGSTAAQGFERKSVGRRYISDWKLALKWCNNYLPAEREVQKLFVSNVLPICLRETLRLRRYHSMEDLFLIFKIEYDLGVEAQRRVAQSGVVGVTQGPHHHGGRGAGGGAGGGAGRGHPQGRGPHAGGRGFAGRGVPGRGNVHVHQGAGAAGGAGHAAPVAAAVAAPVARAVNVPVCYQCGQAGHIRPNCPLRTPAPANRAARTPRLGSILEERTVLTAEDYHDLPELVVKAKGIAAQDAAFSVEIRATVDTGAEVNLVSARWMPLLEVAGAVVAPLEAPINVSWVTGVVFPILSQVHLVVQLKGTNIRKDIVFYVCPPSVGIEMVIGWREASSTAWDIPGALIERLSMLIVMQRSMGLLGGSTADEGNQRFQALDGNIVETDELLWQDDRPDPDGEAFVVPEVSEDLADEDREAIARVLEEFREVFSLNLRPGGALVEPMRIKMVEGWEPPKRQPIRQYSPAVTAAIEQELEEQLRAGTLEPSDASSGSPGHMVVKLSSASGYRFCADFSVTNKSVVAMPFPLPNIQTILDSAGRKAVVKGKLDLRKGYWQFPLAPEDRHKLAVQVLGKVYQYRVVAMGHVDSAFHVQRVMNTLFEHLMGRGLFVYLDDLFLYAPTVPEFITLLREVLSILQRHGLRCKGDKCELGVAELAVLGHILTQDGVRMGEDRKAAVAAMPFPRSCSELRRYLGMANYMRRFIPGYSALAQPLSSKVNTPPAKWPRDEMRAAFEVMQEAVQVQLSLAHLDYAHAIVVSADASVLGVGGYVSNRYLNEDGEEVNRVVACASHAFTAAESRWITLEQEAFALIWVVMHFRGILFGQPFILETDHRNLTYIHGGTSPKVMRWALALQNFRFTLVHVPGVTQHVADALSRAPMGRRVEEEAEAIRLSDFSDSPPQSPMPRRLGALSVETEESERRRVFDACHNGTQGHHGVLRTVEELRRLEREWPRMTRDVTRWIAECPQCQKIRAREPEAAAILSPIGAFSIFEEISVDFVGPLPKDEVGNSYILNAVCSTTRYCELFAVEAATGVIAAHCLLAITARYGCFRRVRSDRGSHFVNEVIEEFLRLFEIQQVLTLAQRPQANALAERNGGEVMRHLRAIVLDKGLRDLWSVMLPLIMRVINRTYKQSVGATPHRLLHWAPTDLDRGLFAPFEDRAVVPPLKSDFVRALESGYERLLDTSSLHILQEQDKVRARYGDVEVRAFETGTYVLMSYLVRPPSKLHCRWEGPFEVMSRQKNTVILRDLTSDVRREVDVSRLRPFVVAPGVDVKALAAADLGEAEVAQVLEHRGGARKRAELEFLVSWTDGDQTWEPWEGVKKLQQVDEYIRAHPEAKLNSLLPK